MSQHAFRYVFLGLSITSSWGNGHATTYRALLRKLAARGHSVTFLERDLPYYADNRDMPEPSFAKTHLYGSLEELRDRFGSLVREADLVVVGSYVPDGKDVGAWAQSLAPERVAFYDIDTPVTLEGLARGDCAYLDAAQVAKYAMYLSFTGGPLLRHIEEAYRSPCARPLYCSVDTDAYRPARIETRWDLGYLGTFSSDRQPTVDALLLEPAKAWKNGRFIVAGAQYPHGILWPENVERLVHLPPSEHRRFFGAQRFTLNVTRGPMIRAGHSPSVRLFEAAACGTPIISDDWPGIETFFVPQEEILVARSTQDVLSILAHLDERERRKIGDAARARVLATHTAEHRAKTFEGYTYEVLGRSSRHRVAVRPESSEVTS